VQPGPGLGTGSPELACESRGREMRLDSAGAANCFCRPARGNHAGLKADKVGLRQA